MSKLDTLSQCTETNDSIATVKVRYALEILKNETIKLVVLLAIFFLLKCFWAFLFALIMLLPLRSFSGGMHMKTNIGCFTYSLAFFFISIKLLPLLSIAIWQLISFLIASVLTIAVLSPVASFKRPIRTEKRRISLKTKTWICLAAESAILIVLLEAALKDYFVIGVWVVTLQAIQLFATWAYRKVKGDQNDKETERTEFFTDGSGRD